MKAVVLRQPLARLSYLTGSDRRQHAEIGPESFGIVVCQFVGTMPDILGWVWPSFGHHSVLKTKIAGWILESCCGAILAQPSKRSSREHGGNLAALVSPGPTGPRGAGLSDTTFSCSNCQSSMWFGPGIPRHGFRIGLRG